MRLVASVLLALLIVDGITGLSLLILVAIEHQRSRRLAQQRGEPVPAAATGQLLFLSAGLLAGVVGCVWLWLWLNE